MLNALRVTDKMGGNQGIVKSREATMRPMGADSLIRSLSFFHDNPRMAG